MTYRFGIDAGSKTIKIVAIDEDGTILRQIYRRHRSNIVQTLKEVVHDLRWMLGEDIDGPVAFTGSAGIGIAEELGAPFIQEVVATAEAVQREYPQADAVIELGGEDAKVIYLTGGVEQRMNASCAGGTGGFIDTIAFMLGVRTSDMDRLAFGCRHIYPIASRCAVFAQTDVRPLINAGVPKADLAGSVFHAVVRQTLGGLACGRPLRGTIVFLGGPLEHNDSLVNMFRQELDLSKETGIKPKDAHLFTVRGAAYFAEDTEDALTLSELAARLETMEALEDDLDRLPPLFTSEEELQAFKERHAADVYPQKDIFFARGPLFLGVDAGSTTVKIAVLDEEGTLVHYEYALTDGDTAETLRSMLIDLYRKLPQPYKEGGEEIAWIARSMVTGYGEDMIKEIFGVDSGVVETAAHLRAARHICPDVSFILDIGGQDMKALWVKDGIITDAVLNEACSSGCGSFIEGTSISLKSTPVSFAKMALTAENPIDLGTRCTVFMTSRVRHAQKIGAGIDDIAAGLAYSVVQNALYRIIGLERVASMGDHIVVQGGTFKSDAILRAFELVSGRDVIRNDQSHLMGAIGAAFLAHDEARQMGVPLEDMRSGLIPSEVMQGMKFKRKSLMCSGCANACQLSMISASDGREYISGNRCSNGLKEFERQKAATLDSLKNFKPPATIPSAAKPSQIEAADDSQELLSPNVFKQEQELLAVFDGTHVGTSRAQVNIGLMNTMELYGTVPFWFGVLSSLGFTVTVDPPSASDTGKSSAWETVPSESVCYPAKLAHLRYFNLLDKDVNAVFMPQFDRHAHCVVASSYARALGDNLPEGSTPLVSPQLSSYKPKMIIDEEQNISVLKQALSELAEAAGKALTDEEIRTALQAGLEAQMQFDNQVSLATKNALDWIAADSSRRGVILAGRSYHGDAAVSKGIDTELQKLDVAVLNMRGLIRVLRELDAGKENADGQDTREEGVRKRPEKLGAPEWRAAKHLRTLAEYAAAHPQIDLVCLQSFGCGYDAISIQEVKGILENVGRPFTVLKIDDITDLAHIRIRLRTLVDAIQKRTIEEDDSVIKEGNLNESASEQDTVASLEGSEAAVEDVSKGVSAGDFEDDSEGNSEGSSENTMSLVDAVLDFDLTTLRQDAVKDACFTAQTMAAHAIKHLSDKPEIDTIELPLVCKDCMFDAVPLMVEHAIGRPLNVKWVDVAGLCSQPEYLVASSDDDTRPRIGVIGNALMCYEPALNDNLVELLDSLGVRAVLPDPDLIQVEDVRYEEQLARFAEAGITEVIYVQSFGCLKGHVQSRGALHQLKKKFPHLNITVIDYDPEASALNRENRIRLVVESLKH